MKLLITGGHLTPALAVIEELRQKHPSVEVIFIGRAFLQEREGMQSREREEMEKRSIPYFEIEAPKFHRTYFWRNLEELPRFFPSVKAVYTILKQHRPDVFLSFGGYLAMPVALLCKVLRIPIITHEQTKTAGLANQWIARLANTVAISYEDSKKFFPREKVVLTGNPVRPSFLKTIRQKPAWAKAFNSDLPMLFVTGGSQGSHVLNTTVAAVLPELLQKVCLVHQCGASMNARYLKELLGVRQELPPELQSRYHPAEWFAEEEVAWLFQNSALVLSRSGANTVQEILVSGVPAVFVPLPFAHNNEQLKNAQWLEEQGSALLLLQKDLLPDALLDTLKSALRRQVTLKKRALRLSETAAAGTAAKLLVRLCFEAYEATR